MNYMITLHGTDRHSASQLVMDRSKAYISPWYQTPGLETKKTTWPESGRAQAQKSEQIISPCNSQH